MVYPFCFWISILAPLTGRDDLTSGLDTQDYNYFNPRAPYGARPCSSPAAGRPARNFNPRAPYGARLHPPGAGDPLALISILAPLTGRDSASLVTAARSERISILAPLTGRDHEGGGIPQRRHGFQSSRPLRGATPSGPRWCWPGPYFNPRAPYGARRWEGGAGKRGRRFQSSRPLRGATLRLSLSSPQLIFQSSRPLRGATGLPGRLGRPHGFQSSRPLRGATASGPRWHPAGGYFNPRAPYGARPHKGNSPSQHPGFQSSRPLRGATHNFFTALELVLISILAPLTGRDSAMEGGTSVTFYFNPRAPYGARRASWSLARAAQRLFQSSRPLRGATVHTEAGG